MKIPLIVWLSAWLLLLPATIAVFRWRDLEPAQKAVFEWLISIVITATVSRFWVHFVDRTSSLVIGNVALPIQGALILRGLSEWQVNPFAKRTVRLLIPGLIAWWTVSFFILGERSRFAVFGTPVLGLLALSAALMALVTRIHVEDEPVLRSSWGWTLTGIALYFLANTTASIMMSVIYARGDMPTLIRITLFKASLEVTALLIIAGGFLWTSRTRFSGISSSP